MSRRGERQRADEPHELGVLERVDDEALGLGIHRQVFEQLLIVDELGARPAEPLDHEVEAVGLVL